MIELHTGDCRDVLPLLEAGRFDACITDPPYHLTQNSRGGHARTNNPNMPHGRHCIGDKGFMGKVWDGGDVAFDPATWRAVFRVLKPGAHLLAFGGTRTYHRMTCAIEDAGFEIRDCIMYLYGSGFPKSVSVRLKVSSRYGEQECDCLDSCNGRAARQDAGREGRPSVRIQRRSGIGSTEAPGDSIVSVDAAARADAVLELQCDDPPQAERPSSIEATVLLDDVCRGRTEEEGCGDAALWSGMEKASGGDSEAGQGLSMLRQDAEAERRGAAHSPSEAVSPGRDKSAVESSGALRRVPSRSRSDHRPRLVIDPDRRESRQVVADDQCGWDTALARVCSWCGRPDRDWLQKISGLGTALKPAVEPIVIARKPVVGTVAENVLAHRTGALNVDACRVGSESTKRSANIVGVQQFGGENHRPHHDSDPVPRRNGSDGGRWPANVCHDGSDEVVELFPADAFHGDTGSAARFFYTAKVSASERGRDNTHATVKPLDLMRYLCRLVMPAGATLIDPFCGSGSTAIAAAQLDMHAVCIDLEAAHVEIAANRVREKLGMFVDVQRHAIASGAPTA